MDSVLALSMKPQVLTIMMSAWDGSLVSSHLRSRISPIMTSESTRFLGHPRLTTPIFNLDSSLYLLGTESLAHGPPLCILQFIVFSVDLDGYVSNTAETQFNSGFSIVRSCRPSTDRSRFHTFTVNIGFRPDGFIIRNCYRDPIFLFFSKGFGVPLFFFLCLRLFLFFFCFFRLPG